MAATPLLPRLAAIVDALPLAPGMRVLEIGGAPGAAAREIAWRIAPAGYVLVIDRSAKGIAQIERSAAAEIESGVLGVRCVAVEDLELLPGEAPFDLAVANRVGALDGRYPQAEQQAITRLHRALTPQAVLFIDGVDCSGLLCGEPR